MNLEHVIDPGVNYYPMYSVEWFDEPTQMWSQHGLTPSKWKARAYAFEVWLGHRKQKRRVRVL